MTLVEFLLARFAETEAEARKMQQRAQDHEAMIRTHQMELLGRLVPGWHDWPDVQRMAAYVIADIEAKRRVLELHEMTTIRPAGQARGSDDWWWNAYCRNCTMDGEYADITKEPREAPCPTLRALALPYTEHPDFREEWVIQ